MTIAPSALRRINSGLFALLLVSGGVLFFAVERSAISEGEKRKLAQMPTFSWRALTSRGYFRAIDDFVADNFAFRYALTELSGEIRAARGWPTDDVQVFTTSARKAPPAAPRADEPPAVPPAAAVPDQPVAAKPDDATSEPDKPVVAAPVAVASGPDEPVVAPPAVVEVPEPDKPAVVPVAAVAPEPDKPVAPPPVASGPDEPMVAPPVAVVSEPDKPTVVPVAAVAPEPDKPVVAPPVAVVSEPDKSVAPPPAAAEPDQPVAAKTSDTPPAADKAETAPPEAVVSEPDTPEPERFVVSAPASVPPEVERFEIAPPASVAAEFDDTPMAREPDRPAAGPSSLASDGRDGTAAALPATVAPEPDKAVAAAPPVASAKPEPNKATAVPVAPVKPAETAPPPQAAAPDVKLNPPNDPYEVVEAIIVYKGRALQIMGGTPGMAAPMIQAVNRYQQELGPEVTVYFMAAPIGSDFYLPEKVNRGVMREKILIDGIHARLNPGVRAVHAYDRLAEHTSEYLYFNTDHHWTGLGAYYAYTAFAQAARLKPLPLSAFSKGEIGNFLGTLYYRTMSPALKAKGDTVEYYKIPHRTEVSVFSVGSRVGSPGMLYVDWAKGANAYGVFLGGDFPLMRVRSDVNNGRRIVVIKDSYGNAFVPYLAAHYQEVFVIDYRSYKGNIKNLIREYGIQDVLFAHNTFVVASGYTAQQAAFFLDSPYQ